MRTKVLIASFLMPLLSYAQNVVYPESNSQTDSQTTQPIPQTKTIEDSDSIKSQQLNEVVVEASHSIETNRKTILYPTRIEKLHSTNGYELLANMNLPEIEVSANSQKISTLNGKEVVVLINGVEALNDELATLSASEIVSIDYQRNPSGKYAGKGGVMNFITRQYDFGGNIFLSYDQGFTHLYEDFLGMVSYRRKAFSVSLTTSAKWNNLKGYSPSENNFKFSQGDLYQKITTDNNTSHNNSQYVRLKLAHTENNHALTLSLSYTRNAQPKKFISEDIEYQGIYSGATNAEKKSRELAHSPILTLDYRLALPKSQYVSLSAVSSFANSSLKSCYKQGSNNTSPQFMTLGTEIENTTKERNSSLDLSITYQKNFFTGITLGGKISNTYQLYRDHYSGNFTDCQSLDNNQLEILAIFSHSIPSKNLSYYVNLGISSLLSRLNGEDDTQWNPTAYYGAVYSPNQNNSFSYNGLLGNPVYDPSFKNNAIIYSSPFEATIGNPTLKPFTVLENSFSYNGRLKNLKLFASYKFVEYLDNLINNFFIEDGTVFRQLQNDGNFYFHTLHAGISLNLLKGKLSIGGNGLISFNHFGSKRRPTQATIFRGSLNANCFLGAWRLRVFYAPQRKAMDWDGSRILDPTQYGFNAQWSHGSWKVECRVENFLKRYQGQKIRSDYGCYKTSRMNLTNAQGRNFSIKVVYTLSYGKKSKHLSDESDIQIDDKINSAILRPF